ACGDAKLCNGRNCFASGRESWWSLERDVRVRTVTISIEKVTDKLRRNAVELIVSLLALLKEEYTIVKTSLVGSMLSNLLLVLGMSLFFGGLNRIEQFFNTTEAQMSASLLAVCVGSLAIPTGFRWMTSSSESVSAE